MESKGRSSRERLQEAARKLFAEHGYEATTVAAIIKLAGTSYSQFIAHFGDKSGVMSAILAEGWSRINSAIRLATARTPSPLARLKLALDVVISYLDGDQVFRRLLLMDRAARAEGGQGQNSGFSEFTTILDRILADMAPGERLAPQIPPEVLRSALVGALEGMLREQLLVEQSGSRGAYSDNAIQVVLSNILNSVLTSTKAQEITVPEGVEESLAGEVPPQRRGDQHWIHHYLDLAAIALGPAGNA